MGPYMFSSCPELEEVILPGSISIIAMCAFKNCKQLYSINIPETVKYIGSEAFLGCKQLGNKVPLSQDNEEAYSIYLNWLFGDD